ncbi:protoheme IX farnesyltransferase [Hydrogenivirga caldilitoris]|uniref:Protoheme IX farnesyltransferase n=1 Tax=Hydrogenivirga caldilitoris TaxID=246264 RepID=A0A497XQK4_9AQUI|nr:heme o synthase [Hydrogenivirga caldilitoris]RLJ70534.1 protoheme IX farnesyltransferase [Hydrogenivirga caldilitoris]
MVEKTMSYTSTLKEYLALTKPGIVTLVLITTLGGMYIGSKGNLEPITVFWTLLGTGLAAAGSAVINMFFDRDIDRVMERTSSRPIPRGAVNPTGALIFGLALILVSFFVLTVFINSTAALLAMIASFSYVVLYTVLLKRRTPIATEVGGISGALPPVIGYVAGSGELDLRAFVLFLIMFMWQPPHFWVLALKYKDDYARAGVPTLPVARGVFITKIKTLIYTVSLLPLSIIPYAIGMTGKLYLVTALVLSILYTVYTLKFLFSKKEESMKLFFFSIIYIAVLFSMMIIDLVKV